MICAVADPSTSNETAQEARSEGGVLTNLPRTRPQRSSARRVAARGATGAPARARKPARSKGAAAKSAGAGAAKKPVDPVGEPSASATTRAGVGGPTPRSVAATKRKAAPRRPAARRGRPAAVEDVAPRQGFECDGETAGGSVAPPGGPELVATAAEIVGELAKAGLSTGERLFKDVLSRLPLS